MSGEETVAEAGEEVADEGFDVIPADVCLRLLREGAVGLLALSGAGGPDVRPVNFALHRQQIVIRTGRGRIFEGARQNEPAAFVISEFIALGGLFDGQYTLVATTHRFDLTNGYQIEFEAVRPGLGQE